MRAGPIAPRLQLSTSGGRVVGARKLRVHSYSGLSWILLAVMTTAFGCSTSGGTFTLFPAGHFLMNTTKDLTAMAPPAPGLPRELARTVLPDYYIEPGDTLLVEPASLDSPVRFPTDQTVLADGTIDLGRYGRIIVAGRTVEQVEQLVAEVVEKAEGEPVDHINVRLISPQGAVYYVLGEVNAPGSFPLIGRETVLDAILAAGGLNSRASTCEIILSRPTPPEGCRVVLPICYRQITQLGDTTTNYQILPGDRIYVATRSLCDELLPWRARSSCELCGQNLQCPCPEPGMADYQPSIRLYPGPVRKQPAPEVLPANVAPVRSARPKASSGSR